MWAVITPDHRTLSPHQENFMPVRNHSSVAGAMLVLAAAVGCGDADRISAPISQANSSPTTGQFQFTPVPASAVCTNGGNPTAPFLLPSGYTQTIVAREPDGGTLDLWDMNTQDETGPHAGRFLYRTHEVGSNGQVSVTDLETGVTRVLAQRQDWERFDGIAWTPWGTLLAAEEVTAAAIPDPAVPQATAGLVYEIDSETGAAVARPAIGSRSHEGMRFDAQGNLYGISESSPPSGGYIYKFVPDRNGDLSSGQLYALKLLSPTSGRTGEAAWVPLDRTLVQVNSDVQATAVQATGYIRPEDVEITTSSGNNQGGAQVLYVAVTGEDRVLGIDLRQPAGGSKHASAWVYDYVRDPVNAPTNFDFPDNLALDKNGNLFIAEDPPSNPVGADIWVAPPSPGAQHNLSQPLVRFASLTDCASEPTGIYFDVRSWALFVHAQHRGGDGRDLDVRIERVE
jgi:hypothetical protein